MYMERSCGEDLRLNEERGAQLSHPPGAQPSAVPSPAAVGLWDSELELHSCPLSKFLTHRNRGREESDGCYFKPGSFAMIYYTAVDIPNRFILML